MGISFATVFVLICVFGCISDTNGACKVSKYENGPQDWVKCSNATISDALEKGGMTIAAIVITTSKIGRVAANAFSAQSRSLSSINLNNCGIRDIDSTAFAGLAHLKKLSLPNNNITDVNPAWFDGLLSLEQLDLSFNAIRSIGPAVYAKLGLLQRLNLNENKLECLQPKDLESMRSLAKIRIEGNRLTLQCRAKITRWFADRGINYKTELDKRESTLDGILWQCAYIDDEIQESELLMKECVLLNLYNQLQSTLTTSDSYPIVSAECVNERNVVAQCIRRSAKTPVTNGEAVRYLLSALRK